MKNKDEFIKIAKRLFSEIVDHGGGKGYRFDHHVRVMGYLERFLTFEEFKDKVKNLTPLLVAALFHDVGLVKLLKGKKVQRYDRESVEEYAKFHAKVGAEIIGEYIGHLVSKEELTRIQEIIKNHDNYRTKDFEIKLLQDADNLDELGFLDVWRMFTFAAFNSRNLTDTLNYWFEENLPKKTKGLKLFHFPKVKKIAEKRIEKISKFMKEIKKETLGKDF